MRRVVLPLALLALATGLAAHTPDAVAKKDPEAVRLAKIERDAERAAKRILKDAAKRIRASAAAVRKEIKALTKALKRGEFAAKSAGDAGATEKNAEVDDLRAALTQLVAFKAAFYDECMDAARDVHSRCASDSAILRAGDESLPACLPGMDGFVDDVSEGLGSALNGGLRKLAKPCAQALDALGDEGLPCSSSRGPPYKFNTPSCTEFPVRPLKSTAIFETLVDAGGGFHTITSGEGAATLAGSGTRVEIGDSESREALIAMEQTQSSSILIATWTQVANSFSGGGSFAATTAGDAGGLSQTSIVSMPQFRTTTGGGSNGGGTGIDFSFEESSSELLESKSPFIATEVAYAVVETDPSDGLRRVVLRLNHAGTSEFAFEVALNISGGLSTLPLGEYVRFGDGADPSLPFHSLTARGETQSGTEYVQNFERDLEFTLEMASNRDIAVPLLARSDLVFRVHVELVRSVAPDGFPLDFDIAANVIKADTRTSE